MPPPRSAFPPTITPRGANPLVACAADPVMERRTLLRHGPCFQLVWMVRLAFAPAARAAEEPAPPRRAPGAPMIGTATMLPDGTIVLQLRAEVPGAVLGDAQLHYPPGDPHYPAVRDHLPGLRPGRTLPVQPFP
ncbi:MAG TPA: hypothetical protein VGC15_00400 [Acetobacteraceae bacterium]